MEFMIVNGREINELHYILPINNIKSILNLGLLSHNRAANVNHTSIASEIIQLRRFKKIPNGSYLHDYVNFYFHARNPMMYSLESKSGICVLKMSEDILSIPNIILSDRNAACDFAKFYPISEIDKLNFDLIYARDWRYPGNFTEYIRRKTSKCAEVLVRDRVDSKLINGAYVKNETAQKNLTNNGFDKEIIINDDIFFG